MRAAADVRVSLEQAINDEAITMHLDAEPEAETEQMIFPADVADFIEPVGDDI